MPNVPLTWLGEHVDLGTANAHDVAAALVKVGLEEEAIHGAQVTGPLVVARVLALVKEEQKNGKTINWCRVDVGPEHNDPNADENVKGGLPGEAAPSRGIICGAHNFVAGDLVVVCLPGTVLPGPFPIAARKTYGHVSDGMICSARELGLGEDHDGIIVLDPAKYPTAEPGTNAIDLLGLGEEVVEINVTPDRGYCFSMRGVAREYAHSTGATYTDFGIVQPAGAGPAAVTEVAVPNESGFAVKIEDAAPVRGAIGCDRFVARIVRGVNASQPSPEWMQKRLTLAGMRPISLAVDVSNYVMLELGQPTHCYDLGTLTAPIVVRRATAGEKFTTLDATVRTLNAEDLLITDSTGGHASRVLGMAGVMGGLDSEITEATTDVLVEAAHFAPVSIARTSRRHKLFSEASKRFERGVDPQLAAVAAQRVVNLLLEFGGGAADPGVTDVCDITAPSEVFLPLGECERLIGVAYAPAQIEEKLAQIGCVAKLGAAGWQVQVPSWRPDLERAADLVEEVARLVGFADIPSVRPAAPGGRGLTRGQRARRAIAANLAAAGLDEVLTYPFAAESVHDAFGLSATDERRRAVRLANPISSEEPEMRTSILATLIGAAKRNVGRGVENVAISEMGQVSFSRGDVAAPILGVKSRPSDTELESVAAAVPLQPRHVAGLLSGQREVTGAVVPGRAVEWLDAIELAEVALAAAGVRDWSRANAEYAPWHPGRCAVFTSGETVLGYAGELHPGVLRSLGLAPRTVAFELDVNALIAVAPEVIEAGELRTFPVSKEDIAVVVDSSVTAAAVSAALAEGAGDLLESIRLFDVFESEALGEGKKSLAFALRFRAADRTLTAKDTADARAGALAAAAELGAVLR